MDARLRLVRILRGACSGELAAIHAYRGHAASVKSLEERERIRIIEDEEHHHRQLVLGLLTELGAKPSPSREVVFWLIGHGISLLCRIGGWFLPMYGAGRLERSNIVEYEDAARAAIDAGRPDLVDCLLAMAEVEWDHEQYFRERVTGHRLLRIFPLWDAPPPKSAIREAHGAGQAIEPAVRIPSPSS